MAICCLGDSLVCYCDGSDHVTVLPKVQSALYLDFWTHLGDHNMHIAVATTARHWPPSSSLPLPSLPPLRSPPAPVFPRQATLSPTSPLQYPSVYRRQSYSDYSHSATSSKSPQDGIRRGSMLTEDQVQKGNSGAQLHSTDMKTSLWTRRATSLMRRPHPPLSKPLSGYPNTQTSRGLLEHEPHSRSQGKEGALTQFSVLSKPLSTSERGEAGQAQQDKNNVSRRDSGIETLSSASVKFDFWMNSSAFYSIVSLICSVNLLRSGFA